MKIRDVQNGQMFWFDGWIYLKIDGFYFSMKQLERVGFHEDAEITGIAGQVASSADGVVRAFYPNDDF